MPQWKDLPRELKNGVVRALAVHNDDDDEPYPSKSVVRTLSPVTLVDRELSDLAGRRLWEKITVDQSARNDFSYLPAKEEPKNKASLAEVVLPTRGTLVRFVDCRSSDETSADHLDRCVEVINGCSGVTGIQFESEDTALAVAKRLDPSSLKKITSLHLVFASDDSAELFALLPSLKSLVVATDELGDSSSSLVPVLQAIPTLESFKSRGYDDFNSPSLADEWKGPIRSLYLDSHMDISTIANIATRLSPTLQEFSVARLPNDRHRTLPDDLDLPHLHTLLVTIDWPRLSVLGLFLESPLRHLTIPFFGGDEDTDQHFVDALLPVVGVLKPTLRTLDLIFVDDDPEEEMLEELRAKCKEQGVVFSLGSYNSMDNNYCRNGHWIDGTPW